ncbi:MAG: hypothetical protein R2784_10975 [Saprospiraceae bacterium]
MSLPLVDFLSGKNLKNLHVFEYGAGNSTFYFAKRTQSVTSVEHHEGWVAYLKDKLPSNSTLEVESLENGNAYAEKSKTCNRKFDIILIDGRNRVECCKASIDAISDSGVFIYDDSHRERYDEGMKVFQNAGYKQIDFWGMGPSSIGKKCTTLFYKSTNCLDI